jgi:hypothetical protein
MIKYIIYIYMAILLWNPFVKFIYAKEEFLKFNQNFGISVVRRPHTVPFHRHHVLLNLIVM